MNFILIPLGIVAYLVLGWAAVWAIVHLDKKDDGTPAFLNPNDEKDHAAILFALVFWPIVLAIIVVFLVVICAYLAFAWLCKKLGALISRTLKR